MTTTLPIWNKNLITHVCSLKLKRTFCASYILWWGETQVKPHVSCGVPALMAVWSKHCHWQLVVFHHWLGSNPGLGMWERCQWLGVRRCFSPGTLVSSTSYNWLVNYDFNMAEKVVIIPNSCGDQVNGWHQCFTQRIILFNYQVYFIIVIGFSFKKMNKWISYFRLRHKNCIYF